MPRTRRLVVVLVASLLFSVCTLFVDAADTILVPRTASWHFVPGAAEASDPIDAWRQRGFDDGAWEELPAPFGYGAENDGPFGTDLSLREPPMRGTHTSIFLRRTFAVAADAQLVWYRLLVDYDDAFVVWINGELVLAHNMRGEPGDPITIESRALRGHEAREYEEFIISEPERFVVPGETNVMAVQAFNVSVSSTDFKFDCELVDPFGPDITAPSVATRIPAAGAIVRRLSRIEVRFDEPVTGVDAADLIVAGAPAAAVSGGGPGPYVFTFDELPPGEVAVSWADEHGIIDLAPAANAFGGGPWSYTLDPDAPPPSIRINEFLASNRGGVEDEDADTSDWIELLNHGDFAVNLSGWTLSDDPRDSAVWSFPDVTLEPGELLVVFASGKNRRDPAADLHTSFQLGAGGEYLALFTSESPPSVVSEFADFPPQRADHSYGFGADDSLGYFETPTPGAPNEGVPLTALAAEPVFSVERGFFDTPFDLVLSTATEGASIWYTTDGSVPHPDNLATEVYTDPLRVEGMPDRAALTLRAVARRDGVVPSRVVTSTYIFPQHVLTQPARPAGFPTRWGSAPGVDYEMDPQIVDDREAAIRDALVSLPTLSIVFDVDDVFGPGGIYSNPQGGGVAWERPCSTELIFPDGREGFAIDCGLRIFGGASRRPDRSPKHSLRLLFKGIYGPTKLRFPLFADSTVTEFDTISLRGNYNNSWIHWDSGQRRRAMMIRDQWAKDTTLDMGQLGTHGSYFHVYLDGLYWGIYNVVERPSAPFAASHMGGDKEEYDALNSGAAVDGTTAAWSAMMAAVSQAASNPALLPQVYDHLDVDNLIDYMLMNFYGANHDWDNHNWYAARRNVPGGQWRFFSWDAERILEGVGDNRTAVNEPSKPSGVHQTLQRIPEYRVLFGDHAQRHLFANGSLTPEKAAERFTERVDFIESAVIAESARWGDYRRDVHPAVNGPFELYRYEQHWLPEKNRLLSSYFPRRTDLAVAQLRSRGLYPRTGAPVFSQHGGEIQPPFALSMALPDGQDGMILYTLDGSDPRVPVSGAVLPGANEYVAPVVLEGRAVVKARTLDGENWSALVEAVFTPPPSYDGLTISEIHFNPIEGGAVEFIELANLSADAIDLAGVSISDAVECRFVTGHALEPDATLVVVGDDLAFRERYPDVDPAATFIGNLANSGERIVVTAPDGSEILSVEYDDGDYWPLVADGFGRSLVLADATADPSEAHAWRGSTALGGSPGTLDAANGPVGLRISEVLASVDDGLMQAIEIHNGSDDTIVLEGWYLSNRRGDEGDLRGFRFPAARANIPPGGYLVVEGSEFEAAFRLSALGDDVYLSLFDDDGSVVFLQGVDFSAAEAGVSFGLWETSTGSRFTAMSRRTLGGPNAAPLVGPVVIHEIQYHPQDGGVEFVELRNLSGEAVDLGDDWSLAGVRDVGLDDGRFTFAGDATIPANGFLLVVAGDPDAFRTEHDVPANVPIVGPFDGVLDNGGERLTLRRAIRVFDIPATTQADRVRYDDAAPWPDVADGSGPSLERIVAGDYGDDVANWGASLAAPGTPGRPNSIGVEEGGGWRLPADTDGDGRVTLTDAINLLGHLFRGTPPELPCGDGTVDDPANVAFLDANGDGNVDLSDPIWTLNWLFAGGAAPAAGTECVRVAGCVDACGN